jgi:hypothetical protein
MDFSSIAWRDNYFNGAWKNKIAYCISVAIMATSIMLALGKLKHIKTQ